MDVVLVAAVAANRVIGSDGSMPWHFPADLERFKATTTGHPVIMGRKTFETIHARLDRPLPDRTSIVLTSDPARLPDHEDVIPATSIPEALATAEETGSGVVYVVGGGTVYEQFMADADRLLLTEIHEAHAGDTRFPRLDDADWTEVEREAREAFDFVTYERRA
jgi:dihydrofolate reductase